MSVDALSATFAALADPTRRDILSQLRSGPRTVGVLAERYPISRPAVSQHLRVLERAGLVGRDRRAQWHDCALTPGSLDEAAAWLEQQRVEWSERFDALDEHLRRRRASSAATGSTDEGEES